MKRASAYITALSGSVLLTLTLGVLAIIMIFFAQLAVEGLLESFGVLAQGWGESHLLMLIGIAALTALPVFIMMFVATWKKILAVELLPQD
ncbi:MAG: hypothetical protein RJS98_12200 [Rhodospirillaceae bacterium]